MPYAALEALILTYYRVQTKQTVNTVINNW